MLRASTTARLSNAGVLPVLHDDDAATAAVASSVGGATADEGGGAGAPAPTDDDEAARLNATYLWLLALAATAECITTCVWPQWRGARVNVGATALNIVGPFLDGLSYGVEALPKRGAPSVACLQFRSAFLGVFTSFPFMVDHAGDLSARSAVLGPLYICGSVAAACAAFHAGCSVVQPLATSRAVANPVRALARSKRLPSLLTCVTLFVSAMTFAAALGPKGFVRDPKDPQFIGALRVADGEELSLGIFMSCSAVLLSAFICAYLAPQPTRDALGADVSSAVDRGSLACNFIACVLVCLAYEASKLSPHAVKNNLLVLKFRRWQAGDLQGALWNLLLHLVVALLFAPFLNKHESAR
ncbi:hypothetical protein PybrP1_012341 [[Pythium] brassicae (nom. inval.)]|nr:hypothetical protein PybrP1_012341 [[Pythium] brassicae (nom. inval.)]